MTPQSPSNGERLTDFVIRRLQSEDIFCGAQEVVIAHSGRDYRLRITSNDKLILTK